MNTKKLFFIILAGLLAGCELGQEPQTVRDVKKIDEVKEVLNSELFTSAGKLKSQFFYQFQFEKFLGHTDWFYNEHGQEILTIGFTAANDTFGIKLYGYDDLNNRTSEIDYNWIDGKYIKHSSNSFTYDAEGNLLSVFSGIDTHTRRLINTNYYNEDGLLELTISGVDQEGEKYVYEYDENNRVSKMSWWGGGESPIMEYFYRYNILGQLEAKETWSRSDGGEPQRDAFQYFYNDKGQLIEEKEFYPQWGFVLNFRKTYEYYLDTEVSGN